MLWSPFLDVKFFNLIPIVNLIHYFVVDKIHFQSINFFLFLAHNIFFLALISNRYCWKLYHFCILKIKHSNTEFVLLETYDVNLKKQNMSCLHIWSRWNVCSNLHYLLDGRINIETMAGIHDLVYQFHKQRAFKNNEEVSPIFV